MTNLILSVADLHFRKPHYAWLAAQAQSGKYDAVVIAGDLLDMFPGAAIPGLGRQAGWVLDWIAAFPSDRTPLFCSTGNHDWWVGDSLSEGGWLQRARRPGVHVDGDVVRHNGLTFACKPWLGPLDLPRRAGPVVLVAHAPPEHTSVAAENGWDVGDFEVRQIAESLPCQADSIILSGHAHEPDAHVDYVVQVACFNSGCSLSAPVPRHFVIDPGARRARLFAGSTPEAAFHY